MKKIYWISGLIIILVVAGYFGYRILKSKGTAAATTLQTATVARGTITSSLNAAGTVRTGQSAIITWQTSGKVADILVNVGDQVEEDQELASLDPNFLSPSIINAQQNLIDAKIALDDLLNSKTQQAQAQQALEDAQKALVTMKQTAAEESSQAQLALAKAQIALEDAQKNRTKMNYPHSSDELIIEKAQTDYLLAKQRYKEALQAYTKVKHKKLTNPERVQALNNLVTAKSLMDTKLATYNWYLLNYTDDDIAQADAEVAVAQANLETAQANWEVLKKGTSAAAIALAEAKLTDAQRAYDRVADGPSQDDIAAAQAAVDAAQATLNQAHLIAPFAGTVTDVNVLPGDLVSSGKDSFHIDDLASMFVDVQVSEVDVNSLKVGQEATLTFDAIPDKSYTGKVTEIGIDGNVSQGVVNYPVTVQITDPDASIKPGMTAAVAIIIAQKDAVLIVPNQAIRSTGGQRTVTILFEGEQIPVAVTVGLNDGTMSEVSSSQLREGDEVVINSSISTTSTNRQGGPGGFGGGVFMRP